MTSETEIVKKLVSAISYAIWQHEGGGTPEHNHWTGKCREALTEAQAWLADGAPVREVSNEAKYRAALKWISRSHHEGDFIRDYADSIISGFTHDEAINQIQPTTSS